MKKSDRIIFVAIILWLLIALSFAGCSPNWHIKRAIKKDPTILVSDTITIVDTVHFQTNRVEVDSVFIVSSDTTIIIKDNLTIRHFISNDSVFIYGECDTVFLDVIRTVKVLTDKIVINEDLPKWVYWIIIALVIIEIITIGIFLTIIKIIRK